jgi:DNA-binding NarL/FixJ family response regulator
LIRNGCGKLVRPSELIQARKKTLMGIPRQTEIETSKLAARENTSAAFRAFELMTNRQMEVIEKLAEGLTNKDIGSRLGITESTVKAYVQTIYQRTRCANRMKLALYWLQYRGVIVVMPILPVEDVGF